jgi:hypothetical protein
LIPSRASSASVSPITMEPGTARPSGSLRPFTSAPIVCRLVPHLAVHRPALGDEHGEVVHRERIMPAIPSAICVISS